jgi:3-dehydroquinate synthase
VAAPTAPFSSDRWSSRTQRVVQRFSVAFEYPVVFTWDAFDPDNSALVQTLADGDAERRHRVLPILDAGLEQAWPELRPRLVSYLERHATRLTLAGEPLAIPGGEHTKNDPGLLATLHGHFQAHRMDRHSFVLVVGGGCVLDTVGYAAATCHRGLRLVRMPSTVLGQNDSGIGVKNGVNAFATKNFLGTFAPPYAVVNDLRLLERLPLRERLSGLAEAVKVALIRDADFFAWLESHAAALVGFEPPAVATMIRRCAELHLRHIATSGDPFEQGSARPLDFGHWAAHKLETLTGHELRHGEAVAIGLVLDSRYSADVGLLPAADVDRIASLVARLGLPRWHPALEAVDGNGRRRVLEGLAEFREHLGGDLTVSLLREIGRSVEVHEMDPARIEKAILWMHEHLAAR